MRLHLGCTKGHAATGSSALQSWKQSIKQVHCLCASTVLAALAKHKHAAQDHATSQKGAIVGAAAVPMAGMGAIIGAAAPAVRSDSVLIAANVSGLEVSLAYSAACTPGLL